MRIEFSFSRDGAYFRDTIMPAARAKTAPLLIGATVLLAAGIVVAVVLRSRMEGALAALASVLAAVVLLVARSWWIRRMVTVPPAMQSLRRWLLTDEGLSSSTELTSAEFAWSTFRAGGMRANAYLLAQDGNVIIDIPRQPLSREQDAELRAFLTARGLLPATGR